MKSINFSLGKRSKFLILSILSVGLALPFSVWAGPPVKFPNCSKNVKIKSVPNGSGVFFDEECSVAYVLPPQQGHFEIKGLTPNMNIKLCSAYESTLRMLQKQYAHLDKITDQINAGQNGGSSESSIGEDTSIDGARPSRITKEELQPVDARLVEDFQKTLSLISLTRQSMNIFENDRKGVAVGKVNYFLDWNVLLEQYRKANPHQHFERLPLEAGRILFGRKLGVEGEIITGAVSQTIYGIDNTSGISSDGNLSSGSGSVIMGDSNRSSWRAARPVS